MPDTESSKAQVFSFYLKPLSYGWVLEICSCWSSGIFSFCLAASLIFIKNFINF